MNHVPASAEHPFAQYVRALGKGPNLSRPLSQDEARDALALIFSGGVEPVQLGAFLCLLRVKTETPGEVAGMVQACRATVSLPDSMGAEIDWPAWAGKSRRQPHFIHAALALAAQGVSVFMHGAEDHTQGRLYVSEALEHLGLSAAATGEDAKRRLKDYGFAYMTLDRLSPAMAQLMDLKRLLGLRSPIHTVGRVLNPSGAPFSLSSVTHPPYLELHRGAAMLLGQSRMATFKGDGGEAERRPEKPCDVLYLDDGQPAHEEWPPMMDGARPNEDALDPAQLRSLWTDETPNPAITGTIAIILRYSGRATSIPDALTLAERIWQDRPRDLSRHFTSSPPLI